jgi:hypothetical protein
MNKFILAAALLAGAGASPVLAATQVSVEDVGSILNESLALPAEDTPGTSIGFQEFFEFTLPTAETITVSMSDSATGNQKVIGGVLSLDTQTSIGPGPLFIPAGSLLESTPLVNAAGGQSAELNPDVLAAGTYFTELSGTSGSSAIHIAIDGTITGVSGVGASATPEPSTWAMLIVGFGFMAWGASTRRRVRALIA